MEISKTGYEIGSHIISTADVMQNVVIQKANQILVTECRISLCTRSQTHNKPMYFIMCYTLHGATINFQYILC